MPIRGAISPQTSPLPSESLSYPSATQDPVAPPKRVVVGRTAAQRLRLYPYLTPASKNQVQPSSGCRQGGRFHLKPRCCPLSLSPTRCPRKTSLLHQIESSSAVQQRYSSVFVRSLTPISNNQVQPSLGCRQGGDFTKKLVTALLTLSRTRHLPKISLLHQNESSSAVQQSYSSVSVRSFTPAS